MSLKSSTVAEMLASSVASMLWTRKSKTLPSLASTANGNIVNSFGSKVAHMETEPSRHSILNGDQADSGLTFTVEAQIFELPLATY